MLITTRVKPSQNKAKNNNYGCNLFMRKSLRNIEIDINGLNRLMRGTISIITKMLWYCLRMKLRQTNQKKNKKSPTRKRKKTKAIIKRNRLRSLAKSIDNIHWEWIRSIKKIIQNIFFFNSIFERSIKTE